MTWRLSAAGVLVLLLLTSPLSGLAEGPVRVVLQAAPLQDEKRFVVNILVYDVTDLYGAELQLKYNPAQLQVEDANQRLDGTQIAPGPFLAAEDRFVVTNKVDVDAGMVTFVVTLLNPAPPVSGSGVLGTVAFRIVGGGPPVVEVTKAQLVSSSMVSIPVVTENLPQPSIVPRSPPLGIPTRAWWAIGIACLLLVVIGVFWWRHRGRASLPAPVSHSGAPTPKERTSAETATALAEQGKRAMNRGDLELAHELYSRAVERDPANAEAWLGKGLLAQQASEKRICFQRVLALDPANSVAAVELQQIGGPN